MASVFPETREAPAPPVDTEVLQGGACRLPLAVEAQALGSPMKDQGWGHGGFQRLHGPLQSVTLLWSSESLRVLVCTVGTLSLSGL